MIQANGFNGCSYVARVGIGFTLVVERSVSSQTLPRAILRRLFVYFILLHEAGTDFESMVWNTPFHGGWYWKLEVRILKYNLIVAFGLLVEIYRIIAQMIAFLRDLQGIVKGRGPAPFPLSRTGPRGACSCGASHLHFWGSRSDDKLSSTAPFLLG